VWLWFRQHPPHERLDVAAGYGSGFPFTVMFLFPAQTNVGARFLGVSVASAKGGGTAVRADGVATWEPRKGFLPCVYSSY